MHNRDLLYFPAYFVQHLAAHPAGPDSLGSYYGDYRNDLCISE